MSGYCTINDIKVKIIEDVLVQNQRLTQEFKLIQPMTNTGFSFTIPAFMYIKIQ